MANIYGEYLWRIFMAIGTIPFVFDKYNNSFANDLATGREAPFLLQKYNYYLLDSFERFSFIDFF